MQRSALESYLSVFQRELSTVVRGLDKLRAKASAKRTLDLAIRLDQGILHREELALQQLRRQTAGRLTQAQVHKLYGPVSHSENAVAVRLAATNFPTVCLGEA